MHRRRKSATTAGYFLQARHDDTGHTVGEIFLALTLAVSRAAELVNVGYRIEIWSPMGLEKH
jgi:hypothetical protein